MSRDAVLVGSETMLKEEFLMSAPSRHTQRTVVSRNSTWKFIHAMGERVSDIVPTATRRILTMVWAPLSTSRGLKRCTRG